MRNYRINTGAPRTTSGRHGTLRNAKGHRYLAIPRCNPPYFGGAIPNYLIFLVPNAPFQTPQWVGRVCTKLPQIQRGAAERHGTLRDTSERDGAPKFGYPALDSAIFWRMPPKFYNIYGARRYTGRSGTSATAEHTKGSGAHIVTRRNPNFTKAP